MIFYSALYNIKRITIDQKQTPCTNTTEEIQDATNENKGSAVEDEGHNSSMNSDHFQITYNKLTHGKHKTSLDIMIANSIYGKTRSKSIITSLNTAGVTVSYIELKGQIRLLS